MSSRDRSSSRERKGEKKGDEVDEERRAQDEAEADKGGGEDEADVGGGEDEADVGGGEDEAGGNEQRTGTSGRGREYDVEFEPQINLQGGGVLKPRPYEIHQKRTKEKATLLNYIRTNPVYSGLAVGIPLSAGALVTMYYYQYLNKNSKCLRH
jgi:hypothetical protein